MNMQTLRSLFLGGVLAYAAAFGGATAAAQAAGVPEGMVLVPAGAFQMGTNRGEGLVGEDAQPQHAVTLPAFYIDKTEVTNAAYKKYCDTSGYPAPPNWDNGKIPDGEENFPVTHINWHEARAYAVWAGKRLPTEAEWEKAARGEDGRDYPWGSSWNPGNVVTNQDKPSAVGSHPGGASPYGALDMAGNVFEWTSDWYDAYPGSNFKSPFYGTFYKIVRGGGFDGNNSLSKTTYRCLMRPTSRIEWVGFRCAVSAAS
jgi:formylglycine-generating enzyme required for sulfatase activity